MQNARRLMFAVVTLACLVAGCRSAATPTPILPTAGPTLPAVAPTTPPPTAAPTPATGGQVINAATAAGLEPVAVLDLPGSFVHAIFFTADGQAMFTGDGSGEVLVWERDTWQKTTFRPAQSAASADGDTGGGASGSLTLSPDGNLIVTDYGEDGAITGRDREGRVVFTTSYGAPVYSMAISPDSKFLAAGGFTGNVLILDLETQRPAAELVGDHEYISNLVFSHDSKTLLVCYERPGNVIKTWDTTTWQETATFTHVTERIDYHDVLFLPGDRELVIASTDDPEIKFLDLATHQVVKAISEHTRAPYQLAFSPDSSLLASASDDGTLRLWNVETGDCVRIIQTIREAGAVAFSPDGTLLAVSVWGEGVQVWGVGQTAAPTATPAPAEPAAPSETPPPTGAGGVIAFYSERDGNPEIYTISPDGSAETRLTDDPARDLVPDVSPDGSQVVFVSDRDGNDDIYRMGRDGSDLVRLTNTAAQESYPYWSADGTKIVFCSKRDDGSTYEIYLMNRDGSDQHRITNNAVSEEWAYLSPDGQKIVYAVGPFPEYSLYVMNVDGSGQHPVFSSEANAAIPKWSPDGGTIAFNRFTLSSGRIIGDIVLINSDGSDPTQITQSGTSHVSENPYWSPDGGRIVFQSNRTGNFQIYVMDADGSNPVRLTDHPGDDYWPSWGGAGSP